MTLSAVGTIMYYRVLSGEEKNVTVITSYLIYLLKHIPRHNPTHFALKSLVLRLFKHLVTAGAFLNI